MSLTSLALIAATILVSSFLSGVFGMAGGLILLGVLLVYFDVAVAMVLFSIIQFAANGWRAVLWWRFVRWPIFFHYVLGSLVAFLALRAVAYVPDKPTVYFLLGIMPFAVDVLPRRAHPNIEWRGIPFLAGALTTVLQFMAGVGGVFLDIFFQKSKPTARPRSPPKPSPRPSATCCAPATTARSAASAASIPSAQSAPWRWRSPSRRRRPTSSSA
jgi:uncharacterized membrane protein YfcA